MLRGRGVVPEVNLGSMKESYLYLEFGIENLT